MAWIPAAIQGGTALYGLFQQNRQQKDQKKLIGAQTDLANEQANVSRQMGTVGDSLIGSANALGAPAIRSLLLRAYGNRGEIQSEIAPETADLVDRNAEAARVASETMGRGGGRAQLLNTRPYATADAVNRFFMQERSKARGDLLNLSDSRLRLGFGAKGAALGGLSGAASGLSAAGNQGLTMAKQSADDTAGLGSGLADAWSQFYKWYKGRK